MPRNKCFITNQYINYLKERNIYVLIGKCNILRAIQNLQKSKLTCQNAKPLYL